MRLLGTTVVASAFVLSLVAAASPALAELQIDLGVSMPPSGSRRVLQSIPPGEATMKAALRNRRGETVQVDLDFDYRVRSPGTVFDEIIDRIEIMVETVNGVPFSSPTIIEPGTINLNPNRAPLAYRATLYRPAGPEGYVVRIRVFGNYE